MPIKGPGPFHEEPQATTLQDVQCDSRLPSRTSAPGTAFGVTGSNFSSGIVIDMIRRPNFSPTLTVSPTAISQPLTDSVSGSSHDLPKCRIVPGARSSTRFTGWRVVASVTTSGT